MVSMVQSTESHWSLLLCCPTICTISFLFFLSCFLFLWLGRKEEMDNGGKVFGFPSVTVWWYLGLQWNTHFSVSDERDEVFGGWITQQQQEEAVYLSSPWLPEDQQLGYGVQFKKDEETFLKTRATNILSICLYYSDTEKISSESFSFLCNWDWPQLNLLFSYPACKGGGGGQACEASDGTTTWGLSVWGDSGLLIWTGGLI